ncbi:dTDP-4-dehydrorhamnose reductase [Danxiaibacter flavus]|uniref:dTDP-4-dehydrorhamnose reductase n=1 Tax=Danxiaibacter flavus TaxID=3049108 RepID=A0ABV3ZBL6_9BACT|nr:dTDP-4-dehydrorhamnose reductase [Chitinophagaceae bacterium DXS]
MQKNTIIVSGRNGQLGNALEALTASDSANEYIFLGRSELDLSQPSSISRIFDQYKPSWFINCAAYTAVDKAESDQENAYAINAEAVGAIATLCEAHNTKLVHISTDYVFNGNGTSPYRVDEKTEPINYYGYSKWLGENLALKNNPHSVIIRTSWVYSDHGNNFVKTMLRLMKDRSEIRVVSDQIGCPTYAYDLAAAILKIVQETEAGNAHYGVYHFSNGGAISWCEFASAIRDEAGLHCRVQPIPTSDYPTPAKRPHYSVMDTQKIQNDFGVQIKPWRDSLKECLKKLIIES